MLRQNLRRLLWTLAALLAICCMALSQGEEGTAAQKTTPTGTPDPCEFRNKQCLYACPINPSTGEVDSVCAEQCRQMHAVCESGAFGASLSPENFMLAVNANNCERYFLSYRRNCLNYGGMVPKHRPVYDACRASGFSADLCCTNIANDFAKSISACEELSPTSP